MHRILLTLFIAGLFLAGSARGGEYNPVLDIGDPAPVWKDLPGVDGKRHSLADLKDKDVVVVCFTCNSCEIAVDYEDRIIAFARKHAGPDSRVAFVAINVNTIEEDRLPRMKERSEEKGFPFPYLYDESQQIGRDYGAAWTPEFFVLNRERRVVYMGGMDNSSQPENVTERYLEPAVEAALRGERPEVAETPTIGCTIRYARQRRTRPAN